MNWKVEIVKAKHWIGYDYSGASKRWVSCKKTAYHDPISDVTVPMFHEPLSSRKILEMEEFSQGNEGVIFLDSETNKIGLLIRS